MPDHGRRRSPARLLAPLALLLAVVAVGYVVTSSTGTGADGDDQSGDRAAEQRPRDEGRQEQPRQRRRAFYTVKLNDTLGLIAEKTGVAVERLQILNPELDPQNLVVGQRIKLRE